MADQLATPQDLASLMQLTYASLTAAQQATMSMLVELATSKVQRAAGGQRIVDVTDTAVVDVTDAYDLYLPLPQLPVRSVTLVKLDGATITDWYVREQKLWRASGWMASWSPPSQATVTYAHGYATGSQWLQLARGASLSLAQMGYGNPTAVSSEAIDDYKVSYADADARMQLTESMRQAIADAYGATAYVTSSR
jgi:hypothetical protein